MAHSGHSLGTVFFATFGSHLNRQKTKRLGYLGFVPLVALFVLIATLWFLAVGPEMVKAETTAVTYYVIPGGPDTGSCTSVAPCSLTHAVDLAVNGDEIRVASGLYESATSAPVLQLSESITVTGGYLSSSWSTPPDPLNTTTLDGNDNGRVVEIAANISPNLQNFHIQNGLATEGAGIHIADGTGRPIIRHNFIHDNIVSGGATGGGGLYDGGASIIEDNAIYQNQSTARGAGIYLQLASGTTPSTIRFNQIYSNTAASAATTFGGGVFLQTDALALFDGNEIYANTADFGGGLAALGGSQLTLYNNMVYNNTAVGTTGTNALGGGLSIAGNATLWNNTIVGNTASANGGGIHLETGVIQIHNTIVAFNNGAGNDGVNNQDGSAAATVSGSYNNIHADVVDSAITLSNPISGNPSFVNLATFNLHLTGGSPARNTGSPSTPAAINLDIDGQLRPNPDDAPVRHEVGADEYYPDFRQVGLSPAALDEYEDRGTTAVYAHTVENEGTLADTYTITCVNDRWAIACPATVGPLAPGELTSINTQVTIPANATAYQVGTTQITVTSQVSSAIFARATVRTTVNPIPGIAFTANISRTQLPGEVITLTHMLTNTGDAPDSFFVEIVSDPDLFDWGILTPLNPLTVTVGSGSRVNVQVRVTVPQYAQAGIFDIIEVRASSLFDPAITASVVNTITARATTGTRYVSPGGSNQNNNCTQSAANPGAGNPGPCQTIQWAIGQATFNDEIRVAPGTYTEGEIFINDTVHLSGGWLNFNEDGQGEEPDASLTVLDANHNSRLLNIASATIQPSIATLTLQNGNSGGSGGAVVVGSLAEPTFDRVIFDDNDAAVGGAIYASNNSILTVRRSTFTNNTAQTDGGALYMASGILSLQQTRFMTNTSTSTAVGRGGGAVFLGSGVAAIQNNLFSHNSANRDGGAMRLQGGQVLFNNNTLVGNQAEGSGGALYNNGATLFITNTVLLSNTAVSGSALFVNAGPTTMDYSNLWHNNGSPEANIPVGDHSIAADALFTDDEFRLGLGSPAIDSGDPDTILGIDFEEDFRPSDQGYDMGWDELAGCRAKRGETIFGSIQDAIDADETSDVILVSGICRGVHTIIVDGQPISQTVHLTQTLTLEGGWKGDFTVRDFIEPTIIDPEGRGRGFYFSGDAAPALEGLIIVNGNATGLGGGPADEDAGGGLYNLDSRPVISGVVVMSSTADLGGGFFNSEGAPLLTWMRAQKTDESILLTITQIMSNTAVSGGGLYNLGGELVVDGARFGFNSANEGGGIFVTGTITVANTVVDQNQATLRGGGLYDEGGTAVYHHLTVLTNTAGVQGGGFYATTGQPVVRSSIFEANQSPAGGGAAIFAAAGAPDVDYNYYYGQVGTAVVGTDAGDNSILATVSAGLIDPANGNFHLNENAPALDTGDPDSPLPHDFEGDRRPSDLGPDIGADELVGCLVQLNDVIYGSIQAALEDAQVGDVLNVSGTCRGVAPYTPGSGTGSQCAAGPINTNLVLTQSVTLLGGWDEAFTGRAGYSVLDARGLGRVLYVGPGITPTIDGFDIIRGNVGGPTGSGAGICIDGGAPTLSHNRFYSNTAASGAAIYAFDSAAVIEGGNRIYSNTATSGAGIYLISPSGITATVQNNFIYHNEAVNGGAWYNASGAHVFQHNTIVGNEVSGAGGAIYVAAGAPQIRGNIVLSHTVGAPGGAFGAPGATAVLGYNDFFQNITDFGGSIANGGPGHMSVDPGFTPLTTAFTITIESPVADISIPGMSLTTDYEGDLRPSHQGFDVGADEVGGCYAAIADEDGQPAGEIYGSVQLAVDMAEEGDTVLVNGRCLNVNERTIDGQTVTQTLAITKTITLNGSWEYLEPISATLDALNGGRVVYVGATGVVTFTSITLQNGNGEDAGQNGHGGALYNLGQTVLISTQISNSVGTLGGGLYNSGNLTVRESYIMTNTANSGGGLYDLGTALYLDGNTFYNNWASGGRDEGYGGAIYLDSGSAQVDVRNNFIYDNQSVNGGGVYNENTNGRIWHNTFVTNRANSLEGGGIYSAQANPDIRNNIIDRNVGYGVYVASGSPLVDYNNAFNNSPDNYFNITPGPGSISDLPNYVDPFLPDFHLNPDSGSPGEDQGDPELSDPLLNPLHLINTDFDGDLRPNNSAPDMGADEINACLIKVGDEYFTVLQDAIEYAETTDTYNVYIARGECRGVLTKNGVEQVGYVREDLHFFGSLPRETFAGPGDFYTPDIWHVTTIINAMGEGRVIYVANNASPTFDQVALVRGNAFATDPASDNGGGIYNAGSGEVKVSAGYLSENSAADGGGYYGGSGSKADFTGMAIGVGIPSRGIRIDPESGEMTLNFQYYFGNSVTNNGGGIYSQGTFDVRNANFTENSAGNVGAGVYNSATDSRLINATFYLNEAVNDGGGIYNTGSSFRLYHNTIRDNNALNGAGGGVYNTGGGFVLNSSIVYTNTAAVSPAGVRSSSGTLAYNNFYQNEPDDLSAGLTNANAIIGEPGLLGVRTLSIHSRNLDAADPALPETPVAPDGIQIIFDHADYFRPDGFVENIPFLQPPHGTRSDVGVDEYLKDFGCQIKPDEGEATVGPGGQITYSLQIYNVGYPSYLDLIEQGLSPYFSNGYTDTITITLSGQAQGWSELSGGMTQTVVLGWDDYAFGDYTTRTLTVTVPTTATVGLIENTDITCESGSLPTSRASDTARFVTRTGPAAGVLVYPDIITATVPGTVMTYTQIVSNTGNETQEFLLTSSSGPRHASAVLVDIETGNIITQTAVTLEPSHSYTTLLRVTILDTAMAGDVATPGVIARSTADPLNFNASLWQITILPGAGTRYVAASGAVNNTNCTDPLSPCATIQHAINQAVDGDNILVAGGTYTDYTTRTVELEPLVQNVFIDKSVSIIGGFSAADQYSVTTQAPITNAVILHGQNERRVIYVADGVTATLASLFIQSGNAAPPGEVNGATRQFGGGIYNAGATLTITGTWVLTNQAQYGAGLYHVGSDLTVNNSVFGGNRNLDPQGIRGEGGGMYVVTGTALLENNTFVNNQTDGGDSSNTVRGGAIYLAGGDAHVVNHIFEANTAVLGDAIFVSTTASLENDYSLYHLQSAEPVAGNGSTGSHDRTGDPLFVDDYYHIGFDSAAKDQGTSDPAWVSAVVRNGRDFDRQERIQGPQIDIGADEKLQRPSFVFLPTPLSSTVNPGEVITYYHTLTNTGDFTDTYAISLDENIIPPSATASWDASFAPTTITNLAHNEAVTVTLVVTAGVPGSVHVGTLTAVAESGLVASIEDTTTVTQTAGVDVRDSLAGSGLPGETLVYAHTLQNTGNGLDEFDLTATAVPTHWLVTLTPTQTGFLNPGQTIPFTVTVQIPANAISGTQHEVVVTAAATDPAASDTLTDTTTVERLVNGLFLTPNNARNVQDGVTVVYTHTLTNDSNAPETVDLTIAGSRPGWTTTVAPAVAMLAPFGATTVEVTVIVPPGTGGMVHTAVVTATGRTIGVAATAVNTTTVQTTANVLLTPDQSRIVDPGDLATYEHRLTNLGNLTDTITLTGDSALNWLQDLDTGPYTLGPGEGVTVTAVISVPVAALPGVQDSLIITATSGVDSAVFDTVEDTTRVAQTHDLAFFPDHDTSVDAGTTVVYTHTLHNTGNGIDTFQITWQSSPLWTMMITPMTATLDPGEQITITMILTTPAGAPGLTHEAILTATSTISGVHDAAVMNTTHVNGSTIMLGVDIEPDRAGLGVQGETIQYQHTVTNTGTGTDDYTLTAVSSQNWVIAINPTSLRLAAGESAPILVSVTISNTAIGGVEDITHIFARSDTDNNVYDVVTDTTRVRQEHGLSFTPDHDDVTDPGTTVVYTHTLVNTGDGVDSLALTWLSTPDWGVTIAPTQVSLLPNEAETIVMTLTVPAGAAGRVNTTTITATSTISPAFGAAVTNVTTVNGAQEQLGVDIEADSAASGAAGTTVQYVHTVTNTGEVVDTYEVTAVSASGWTAVPEPTQLTLTPGQSDQVTITVTIPASASPGQTDETTVTARSTIEPTITDVVVDTTTVTGQQGELGVTIAPDYAAYGRPGDTLTYVHTITNTGETADSYLITLNSTQNWGQTFAPATLALAAGESAQVVVTVTIPTSTLPGATDISQVTVRSQFDNTIADTATDTTRYPGLYLPIMVKSPVAPPPTPTATPTASPTVTPSPTPRVCGPATGIDLVVTNIQIVPDTPAANQPVTVYVTIRNNGPNNVAYGNNFWLDFYVDHSPAPNLRGEIEWGVQGVLMTAGHSETFSHPYTFDGGTHQLWAQVDTDDTVNECPIETEQNNQLGTSLIVTGASSGSGQVAPSAGDGPRHTPTPAFGLMPSPTSTPTPPATPEQ